MADKQTQALKRLTKKLSALRKTLRKDERELLDALILGDEAAAEVNAHSLVSKADRVAKADVTAHQLIQKADRADKADVVAHQLIQRADRVAKADAVAEVQAHRLNQAAVAAVSIRSMVDFDAVNGKYVIAAEEPEVEGHLLKEAVNLKVTQVTPKAAQ
jgi:hypothetical protein